MNKKLDLDKLKKHFGERLTTINHYGSSIYLYIDNDPIGYFDPDGSMSVVGEHIELNPDLSLKYFNISVNRTLKRYFTNKGFIDFIEKTYMKGKDGN